MHYVEMGHGPVVILLHGFPELWYIWKYQVIQINSTVNRIFHLKQFLRNLKVIGDNNFSFHVTFNTEIQETVFHQSFIIGNVMK